MEVQKLMALFLLCLATTASVGWCRMVDTSSQEVTHDDEHRADARADWAASKISEGVGASSNSGPKILASSKVSTEPRHTANDAIQTGQVRRTMESTSDMAEDAKNEASDAYNKASEASGPAMETVGDMASDMADKIKEGAQNAYDFAFGKVHGEENVQKTGETVRMAAEEANSYSFEEAREKAYDAYLYAGDRFEGAKEAAAKYGRK